MIDDTRIDAGQSEIVWNQRSGTLLGNKAILVLDEFKGHLISEVKKKNFTFKFRTGSHTRG